MTISKNLIAIAITALAGGSVFAQNTVNSQVSGGAVSFSAAGGNSSSTHSASAAANNSSTATGTHSSPTVFGPYYQASATGATSTSGSTLTTATGIGVGMSSAGASEAGTASSIQSANAIKPAGSIFGIPFGNGGTVGNVAINSLSQVGTQSAAGVVNTGLASSGTTALANNKTSANVAAPVAGSSTAVGSSSGLATANAASSNFPVVPVLGNSSSASAGGTLFVGTVTNVGAFQNGGFSGTITRP